MAEIIVIQPRGGKTTAQMVLELIKLSPNGLKVIDISKTLNRPISMIQICLKQLKANGKVHSRKEGMNLVYFAIK